VEKPAELTVFARASLRAGRDGLVVTPLPSQVSGNLTSSAMVDALAVLPRGKRSLARGAAVEAIVLRPAEPGGAR
jgi:molybdopterin molybdotransferase